MKKILVLLSCALLTLSLVGCSQKVEETESEALFKAPGTYSATVAGRNGDVIVSAEFTSDEIVSIHVESVETETIGITAMNQLTETILENQSMNVDTVAGATVSTEAYLDALENCIEQAQGDLEILKAKEVQETFQAEIKTEADVLVIGAGGAGLTAALSASENGASVILIEKSNLVGGNTLCATMGINAAESSVQTDAGVSVTKEDFVAAQMNNEDAHEELVEALVNASGETIDWIASQGVEFTIGGNSDFMLLAEADGKTTTTIINALNRSLQNSDVELVLNMDATTLVTTDGVVTGVIAKDENGNEVEFKGKSVILVTGGFGQNSELLADVRPDLANAITDEIAPTTGEGLLMAQALGAATVNLEDIQLFPHVIVGYGLLTPNNIPGGFKPQAIFVNQEAERFTVEGFEVSEAILAQPEGMAYAIFTEEYLNDTLKELLKNGFVVSAETPEELAEKIGLDSTALANTISTWNTDCASGVDTQFGREENLTPLEGTLYAYNFGVGAHYFMGGILINESTQVLNQNNEVIDGLYAAGEVTGGFHGNYRVDGSGTADALVFGRIAGQSASMNQ